MIVNLRKAISLVKDLVSLITYGKNRKAEGYRKFVNEIFED